MDCLKCKFFHLIKDYPIRTIICYKNKVVYSFGPTYFLKKEIQDLNKLCPLKKDKK